MLLLDMVLHNKNIMLSVLLFSNIMMELYFKTQM